LGDVLGAYLKDSGLAGKMAQAQVFGAWHAVVGEAIARRARAVRFREGELLVEVRSAAHLHELANFTGEGFRRAANERLGAPRIERVVFQLER
jgi:hypothetical protein